MNATPAIETRRLVKTFERRGKQVRALSGLTATVERGSVAALAGPNGCGKTTTLKVLATLVLPTSGLARVMGLDVASEPSAVRRLTGVSLGSGRSFYWRLTARHNLEFFARLRGVAPSHLRSAVTRVAAELDLERFLAKPVRGLSKGTLARLSAARAFLGDPAVLLLDEPFASVDARGRDVLWDAITRRARAGCTVVLATHDRVVASRCDRVIEPGSATWT